ncbi:helix-turn-helix domain-containing protein, partial [Candidatus Parcubacteria bacterium]|nr:helix-turn-helix domain-containing protein [Candidatus Parcubacteria bacterium]
MEAPDLIFDGKKFISARSAAQRTKYAPDYIGQLCRGGKLKGRRIGRAWYVEERSLMAHLAENGSTSKNHEYRKERLQEPPRSPEITEALMEAKVDERVKEELKSFSRPIESAPLAHSMPPLRQEAKREASERRGEFSKIKSDVPGGFHLVEKASLAALAAPSQLPAGFPELISEKISAALPAAHTVAPYLSKLASAAFAVALVFAGYEFTANGGVEATRTMIARLPAATGELAAHPDQAALSLYAVSDTVGDALLTLFREAGVKFSDALMGDAQYQVVVTVPEKEREDVRLLTEQFAALKEEIAALKLTSVAVTPSTEKIIERVITTAPSGLTRADLNQLENALKSEIYRISSVAKTDNSATYAAVALTNRINELH